MDALAWHTTHKSTRVGLIPCLRLARALALPLAPSAFGLAPPQDLIGASCSMKLRPVPCVRMGLSAHWTYAGLPVLGLSMPATIGELVSRIHCATRILLLPFGLRMQNNVVLLVILSTMLTIRSRTRIHEEPRTALTVTLYLRRHRPVRLCYVRFTKGQRTAPTEQRGHATPPRKHAHEKDKSRYTRA